jgi:hypothetical protein
MVSRDAFDLIKRKHGPYGSWAVWAEGTEGPKSNVGDLRVLDPDRNPRLLETLRDDVVMLGLNLARFLPATFANFHDPSPTAQDYKIRHAFTGTPYYGAYMTDIVKGTVMLDSRDLVRHIASRPELLAESLATLLDELDDLGAVRPTLVAFGNDTLRIATRLIPPSRYRRLAGVTHYSHYISKEEYRARVLGQLSS